MMTWRELIQSGRPLPDDTALPCEDGKFAKSSQEAPLREILTESLLCWLDPRRCARLPFFIAGDSGIYWCLPDPPEPLVNGAIDPDWYYVPKAPPEADGRFKASYVMWHERVPPLIVLEFVLPGDVEARDRTPWKGKYWIYEQALGVPYYGIYEMETACLLAAAGVEIGTGFERIAAVRGRPVPDTPEQRDWVGRFTRAFLPVLRAAGAWR